MGTPPRHPPTPQKKKPKKVDDVFVQLQTLTSPLPARHSAVSLHLQVSLYLASPDSRPHYHPSPQGGLTLSVATDPR